jgi:hypothetical protein
MLNNGMTTMKTSYIGDYKAAVCMAKIWNQPLEEEPVTTLMYIGTM